MVDQSIAVQRPDFILAGASGGTWRLVDGRVQKWNSNQLEKDLGRIPGTNTTTIVTSACEDNEGNLIVGTLGAGVFWYEPDGNCRQISEGAGFVVRLCAFAVHGSRRESLGRHRRRRIEPRSKEKFSTRLTGLRPLAAQSVSEDEHGGLWTAFNAQGLSYWNTNSAQDFGVGRSQSARTVLVDHKQQVWVGTREEGLFQFQTNHFVPAPGAEILGQQIFALFEDQKRPTVGWHAKWTGDAGMGNSGNCSRRTTASRKMPSVPSRRMRMEISGLAPRIRA